MSTPATPVTTEQSAAAPAPAVGTAEYNAAMTARAAAAGIETPAAAPAAKPTKPEGIPDKFWDAEKGEVRVADLAKSYAELEKTRAPAAPAAPAPAADPAAAAAVAQAGFDIATLETEYAEKGSITPETRAALAAKGITASMVDSYIAGRQALADKYDRTAFEVAGDEAKFNAMAKWATNGLKPSELTAYNAAVVSGDVERMKLAVAGVRAKYEAANGVAPNLITGDTGTVTDVAGFANREEMKAAIRDPRYKKDAAYRKSVEQRMVASAWNQVQVLR